MESESGQVSSTSEASAPSATALPLPDLTKRKKPIWVAEIEQEAKAQGKCEVSKALNSSFFHFSVGKHKKDRKRSARSRHSPSVPIAPASAAAAGSAPTVSSGESPTNRHAAKRQRLDDTTSPPNRFAYHSPTNSNNANPGYAAAFQSQPTTITFELPAAATTPVSPTPNPLLLTIPGASDGSVPQSTLMFTKPRIPPTTTQLPPPPLHHQPPPVSGVSGPSSMGWHSQYPPLHRQTLCPMTAATADSNVSSIGGASYKGRDHYHSSDSDSQSPISGGGGGGGGGSGVRNQFTYTTPQTITATNQIILNRISTRCTEPPTEHKPEPSAAASNQQRQPPSSSNNIQSSGQYLNVCNLIDPHTAPVTSVSITDFAPVYDVDLNRAYATAEKVPISDSDIDRILRRTPIGGLSQLNALYAESLIPMYCYTAVDGIFIWVNDAYAKLIGLRDMDVVRGAKLRDVQRRMAIRPLIDISDYILDHSPPAYEIQSPPLPVTRLETGEVVNLTLRVKGRRIDNVDDGQPAIYLWNLVVV